MRKTVYRLKKFRLTEISLVDRPACDLARVERIELAKRALPDQLVAPASDPAFENSIIEANRAMTTRQIDELPDTDFAYIEPGGTKDADGKTVPRSLRHFPILDAAHVRDALTRVHQSPLGHLAMPAILDAARTFGIETDNKAATVETLENTPEISKAPIEAQEADAIQSAPIAPQTAAEQPSADSSISKAAALDAERMARLERVLKEFTDTCIKMSSVVDDVKKVAEASASSIRKAEGSAKVLSALAERVARLEAQPDTSSPQPLRTVEKGNPIGAPAPDETWMMVSALQREAEELRKRGSDPAAQKRLSEIGVEIIRIANGVDPAAAVFRSATARPGLLRP